jgi:parallel beta-helix repeat protein
MKENLRSENMKRIISIMIVVMLLSIGFLAVLDEGYKASDVRNIRSSSRGQIITQNTTWTLANSPFIITENITVAENVTLTIQPGVEVKFDGLYRMIIKGTLIANGKKNSMINFTTNNSNPHWWANWHGLKFHNAKNNSIINYCNIEYAGIGISCTYIRINISNSTFKNNYAYGIYLYACDSIIFNNEFIMQIIKNNKTGFGIYTFYGNSIISNNTFSNGAIGLRNDDANTQIQNNYFYNNKWGILADGGNVDIFNNILINNHLGIYSGVASGKKHKITYNTIKDNYWGISSSGASIIKYNNITNNTIGIQTDYGGAYPTPKVNENNIYNNKDFNINNTNFQQLNATNNWWGTTNTSIIDDKIFDYHDNGKYGEVIYKPIRKSPFGGSPNTTNYPPTADAGPDQYVKVNQTVNFDGSVSYDPDGDTLTYKWDFGDSTSTGWLSSSKTSHSYNKPGNYTVTLTVSDGSLTDNNACKISVSRTGNNNTAPVANAGPDQYVKVNQTVNFDGGKSYDPDTNTLSYKWDFGDSTSTGWLSSSNTSHSYISFQSNCEFRWWQIL